MALGQELRKLRRQQGTTKGQLSVRSGVSFEKICCIEEITQEVMPNDVARVVECLGKQ